ncbi:hypothetical protein LRR81_12580 [Metabacillus sp. GX 13764]|uniref:hypothetical protein n=1 Tax=Metabacillus kandeliae TaxID=2900151 RepID=UPI001E5ECC26|nr:hypothetical protein [Metabacillus kandeliae]MCD7035085.1 hypothetical protein [Metabacillus kandeliae]
MYKQSVFILGLIGSILGVIGIFSSFIFLVVIWGFIMQGTAGGEEVTDSQMRLAVFLAVLQSVLAFSAIIASFVLSLPLMLKKNQKLSGSWLIGLSIFLFICDALLIIPAGLLLAAGILGVQDKSKGKYAVPKAEVSL